MSSAAKRAPAPAERQAPREAGLRPAERQAKGFERVREAHKRETAEDYLELVADLIAARGEARAVDLAERLGVTPATVNVALGRLAREGLVERRRYRSVFLTDEGRRLAERAKERHRLVRDFLLALGVEPEAAEADAEGIEHHAGRATLDAMRRFLARREG